jgi:hypothetical protein
VHGVHDREYGGIEREGQRENDDGDESEAAIAVQAAKGESEIKRDRLE